MVKKTAVVVGAAQGDFIVRQAILCPGELGQEEFVAEFRHRATSEEWAGDAARGKWSAPPALVARRRERS